MGFVRSSGLIAGLLFFVSAGCIDKALAIKAYSQERDILEAEVKQKDALFVQLLELVKSGRAQETIKTADTLTSRFGDPVLKNPARSNASVEEWLYRKQICSVSCAKIYVSVAAGTAVTAFRLEN